MDLEGEFFATSAASSEFSGLCGNFAPPVDALAEVCWPLPDEALEVRLFPASTALAEIKARWPQPDWRTIRRELRRKGVTLQLLWEDHRGIQPGGSPRELCPFSRVAQCPLCDLCVQPRAIELTPPVACRWCRCTPT